MVSAGVNVNCCSVLRREKSYIRTGESRQQKKGAIDSSDIQYSSSIGMKLDNKSSIHRAITRCRCRLAKQTSRNNDHNVQYSRHPNSRLKKSNTRLWCELATLFSMLSTVL